MRTLLLDKFTDTNGTALNAHDPDVGGPWTQVGAGLVIQGNKLTGSDASGECSAPLGSRLLQMDFTFDLNGMDAGSAFTIFAEKDGETNTYQWVQITGDGNIQFDNEKQAGADDYVTLPTRVTSGDHRVSIVMGPSQSSVYLDGALLVRFKRQPLPSDEMGTLHVKITAAAGTYPLISDLLCLG